MKKSVLLILLVFTVSVFAAGPDKISYEYPWQLRSVAALGMGDVNFTKSNDKYAAFYNPAGLARIKDSRVDFIPVNVQLNKETYDFLKDFKKTDTKNNDEVARLLNKHIGENLDLDASLFFAYTKTNFMFGVFSQAKGNGLIGNPVLPELSADAVFDSGIILGFAEESLGGKLQSGLTLKGIYRNSLKRDFTIMDIVDGELDNFKLGDNLKKSWGAFADFGFIYNFITKSPNPRVGISANNLGTNAMGSAKEIPYSLNISAGISPGYKDITTDIMVDVRDVTKNFKEDKSWGKRINAGVEITYAGTISLRSGIHQGYLTYGAGLSTRFLALNYAYYKEEIGTYAGQKASKRHALELIVRF